MESLFDLVDISVPHTATPHERFLAFHHANPQVFQELERMARELRDKGRSRIGIRMLWETLRWNYYMRVVDQDSIARLNNNYTSHYVRLLLEVHPDWDGLFQLRAVHDTPATLVRKKASHE